MQNDIIFHPKESDPSYFWQVAVFSGCFFLFVQFAFLEGFAARMVFTIVFAGFLLLGLWSSVRIRQTWPQRIAFTRDGISYNDLRSRHGVDLVPWSEIKRLDLFYNQHNMAPFLRIGLRSGAFRKRLKRPRLQRWSMGLDINIPVAVNVAPEVVLQTARQFWIEAGQGHAQNENGDKTI